MNAKADFGQLRAEVLDERRNPIRGFGMEQCQTVRADSVEQAMRWKDASLASLRGRPVRLRFRLENVRLYSFRIA